MATEEDIELTDAEIKVARLALSVMTNLLKADGGNEEAQEELDTAFEESLSLGKETNLIPLLESAHRKFGELTDEEPTGEA